VEEGGESGGQEEDQDGRQHGLVGRGEDLRLP
jgi:hypothetical protein